MPGEIRRPEDTTPVATATRGTSTAPTAALVADGHSRSHAAAAPIAAAMLTPHAPILTFIGPCRGKPDANRVARAGLCRTCIAHALAIHGSIELMYRKFPPRLELSRTEGRPSKASARLITGLLRLALCRSSSVFVRAIGTHSPRFGTSTDCRIYTAVSSDLPHRRRRLTSQIALRVRPARLAWALPALRPCLPSRCPRENSE